MGEPLTINGVRYVPASKVAREVNVSRQTLWRWRQEGKIPAGHRFRDGRVLFTPLEVEEVRRFANRLEPISQADREQLPLF